MEFYLATDRASEINFTYSIPDGVYVGYQNLDTGLKNIGEQDKSKT